MKIKLVDGNAVKTKHTMDFVEGGQHGRYPFIPRDEVWVDKHLSPSQRPYVALHEIDEHARMTAGKSYEKAHAESNKVEKAARLQKAFVKGFEKRAEHPEFIPSDPDKPARMSRMSMLIRPSGKGKVLINRDLEEKEAPFVPYTELAERELMGIFGFSREQAHALVSRLHQKSHLKEAGDEGHGVQDGRR